MGAVHSRLNSKFNRQKIRYLYSKLRKPVTKADLEKMDVQLLLSFSLEHLIKKNKFMHILA